MTERIPNPKEEINEGLEEVEEIREKRKQDRRLIDRIKILKREDVDAEVFRVEFQETENTKQIKKLLEEYYELMEVNPRTVMAYAWPNMTVAELLEKRGMSSKLDNCDRSADCPIWEFGVNLGITTGYDSDEDKDSNFLHDKEQAIVDMNELAVKIETLGVSCTTNSNM